MAKKSTAARNSGAARRPQTTAKSASRQATLVRTPGAGAVSPATTGSPEMPTAQKPLATSTPRASAAPARATAKPTATPATKPATRAPATGAGRMQTNRLARAQATQRARAAHLISAENYAYVLNDLRLTGILAAAMFLVIIILHFVLG